MPTYITVGLRSYSGWKASTFFSATSLAISLFGSSRSPKTSAPVGQASTQRGSLSPSSSRCAHMVHFCGISSSLFQKTTRYGQALTMAFWPLALSGR